MIRSKQKRLSKLVTSGVALALGVGGMGYTALHLSGQRTPDRYGCFDGIEQAQTQVLVDASEPRFDPDQVRSLQRYFQQSYDTLTFNERLSFYTSEGDQIASVARSRFHVCGQATHPEQLEAINAGTGSDGYLKKQQQRLYEKVLEPELDALFATDAEDARRQRHQSPILELIADLSRLPTLKPGSRLIIVSDLLQNSDSAQFCRVKGDMPSFAKFKQRAVYQRLKPQSLQGVEVEVLMLQRHGYGQGGLSYCSSEEELKTFWRDYLQANGVRNSRFIRIRSGMEG